MSTIAKVCVPHLPTATAFSIPKSFFRQSTYFRADLERETFGCKDSLRYLSITFGVGGRIGWSSFESLYIEWLRGYDSFTFRTTIYASNSAKHSTKFVPSTLFSGLMSKTPNRPRLTSTSSLHGLRGLGACAIFTRHLLISFWDFPDHGFTGDEKELFIRYPVLRAPFAGNAMVVVFLVVSGYLDSIKPLQLIQDGKWEPLQRHLASAMFRRGLRLFLPALLACVLIAFFIWLGLYDWGEEYRSIHFASKGGRLLQQNNICLQLRDMLVSFSQLLDLTQAKPVFPVVNIHLWTLPVELRCSFLRYSTLLCISRLQIHARIALLFLIIAYFFVLGRWEYNQ